MEFRQPRVRGQLLRLFRGTLLEVENTRKPVDAAYLEKFLSLSLKEFIHMNIIIGNELFINVSLKEKKEHATNCTNIKVTKLPLDLNANPENREQKRERVISL